MEEEKRSNGGYEIIEGCTIGSTELVIGHNPKAPNPMCVVLQGRAQLFLGDLLQYHRSGKGKSQREIPKGVPYALQQSPCPEAEKRR